MTDMDKELRRLRKHNLVIWVLLTFLLVLLLLNMALVYFAPKPATVNNYIEQKGKDGKSIVGPQGPAGYTPMKGIDYFDGRDGKDGAQGIQGIQGIPGLQGPMGEKGETGAPGEPGKDGREVEFRHNDRKSQTEWRYVGDLTWQVLFKDCQITKTCIN